jgi:hypothetical protein
MALTSGERRWCGIAIVVALAAHGLPALFLGVKAAPDTLTYSHWADRLIAVHFDYARYLAATAYWNVPPVLYAFFVTIVAVAKLIAGQSWQVLIVVLQVIADSITAVLVAILASRFGGPYSPIAAIVLYAITFDIAVWVRFPLTDIFFMCASFAAFACAVWPERTNAIRLAGIAITIIAALLRPVGFLWLILIAVIAILDRWPRLRRPALFTGAFSALLLAFTHTYFMMHPERWPFRALRVGIEWNARQYLAGVVVQDRPAIAHATPVGALDFCLITIDRIAHFYAIFVSGFSALHVAAALIVYVPLFALAAMATVSALRQSSQRAFVIRMSAVVIVVAGLWHALTNLDFDWRYRLPLLPHFIFLASVGSDLLIVQARRLFK